MTAEQLALFDRREAIARRDEALASLQEHYAEWFRWGLEVVRRVAETQRRLTSDDLRRAGLNDAPHPNCWGSLMKAAVQAGLVRGTAETVRSSRPEAKGRRVLVWRSRIYRPERVFGHRS